MKKVSALIVAVLIAVISIPQLRIHAEGSGVIGAFVYDGSAEFFSGEQLTTAQMLYKLTKSEYNQYDFGSILSNIPASSNGYTNYLLYSSNSTLSLSYFPDGVFCVFDDNFSSENRSSYASRFGLSSISNYGVFFYDYIQDDNSPTTFELFTCNLSSGEWGTSQTYNLYYTNLGTEEHYNYYSAGKKTLIGGNCPVYSVAEAVGYDTTKSQSNMYMPIIIENMDSLTNYNSGSIPIYNGESMVVPDPGVEIEDISNHLYAKDFDIFFAQSSSNMSNGSAFDSIGGGYLVFKYTLDDYAKTHINDMFLSVNYSVHFDNEQYTGAYQGRLDPSGYTIVSLKDAFQNSPYWAKTHFLGLFVQKNAFYQNYHKMDIMSFSTDTWAQLYSYANNNSGGSAPTNMAGAIDNYVKGLLNKYTGFYFGYDGNGVVEGLYDFWDALRANMIENPGTYQSAYFTGTAIIQNNADILNTSGSFTNKIDFKTGVTSVIDNGITINENPFSDISPYDIVPYSPDDLVQYGSNGGAYATVGNIVNQITIPGYKELKADIDATPDGNFTQFLAPFYNNEVGSWFFSFVDDMPPEMKAILISGCGVGVLFGIARYVRRS